MFRTVAVRSRSAHAIARVEERRAVAGFWARAERYSDENRAAAGIILADPEHHGGESAGLVRWARMAMRHEAEGLAAA